MIYTDLKELRVRLECHFDMVCYDEDEEKEMPDPLGAVLLSAIDLLKILEEGKWQTVPEVLKAWQNRDDMGTPRPRAV
jgi:hypothetical protein